MIMANLTRMKYNKAMRHRNDPELVFREDDPVFGTYTPEFYKDPAMKLENMESSEIHKQLFSNLKEDEDLRFNFENVEDAMFYEQYRQTAINYFKAKQQFLSDQVENQAQLTLMEYEQLAEKYTLEDKYTQSKLDYMYNFMDYDNERANVRQKYLQETNKRVDLRDIGEMLDDLVFENKAKLNKHYDLREHHAQQPKRPT